MDTLDKVKVILVEQLGVRIEDIGTQSLIVEDLAADSLDAVEILMALEETFDITISDGHADTLKTVDDIVKYVDTRLEEKTKGFAATV